MAAAHALVDAERLRAAEQLPRDGGPAALLRTVIRLSDHEVWYTQLGHHLVFDGYTAAMLARRTGAHYTALVRRRTAPPSPVRAGSPTWSTADRTYRDSEQLEKDRAYWRDRLTPLPELGRRDDAAVGPPERTAHRPCGAPARRGRPVARGRRTARAPPGARR